MAIFTNGVFPAGGEAGNGGGIIQIKQTVWSGAAQYDPSNSVATDETDLTNLDWVKKDFRLGNNAFSDVTLIQTIKDYIETNKIENEVFLFSASAFSNVAQYELGKFFKRNTYIDIGTSLSHEFGIPAEREYLIKFKEGKLSELKSCTWN